MVNDLRTDVMGILNVTPDSFSDGGALGITDDKGIFKVNMDSVLNKVQSMIYDGAALIDVGGESTRPGADKVNLQEEIERVIPVIENIKSRFDVEISVDTYKAKCAEEAIRAGASMVNDIGGLRLDENMGTIVAKSNVKYVLMHNDIEHTNTEDNYVNQVINDIKSSISQACACGIATERIIIDPGIGFNKSFDQNVWLLNKLDVLCKLNYPVLLGCSNKSFIGKILDNDVIDRLPGTLAVTAYAVMQGVRYVRVHDVKSNYEVIKTLSAILDFERR